MTRLLCQQTLLTAKGTNKSQLFRDSASTSISPVAQDVWFAQLIIEIKVDAQIVILRVGNELADVFLFDDAVALVVLDEFGDNLRKDVERDNVNSLSCHVPVQVRRFLSLPSER